jgi:hypothetical protein
VDRNGRTAEFHFRCDVDFAGGFEVIPEQAHPSGSLS